MNKILLIGCGYWGKNWYNTIKRTKQITLTNGETVQVNVAGVVDPYPSISVEEPCFNSLGDVDVPFTHAIIATQAELHMGVFEELITKIPPQNVLVEKPCGRTLEERLRLSKAFPGYIFLSSPQYHAILKIVMQQKLGRLLYVNFERASMGPRIRTDVDIVEDYMIHDLYLYVSLFCQVGDFNLDNFRVQGYLQHNFDDAIKADTAFFSVVKNGTIANFFSSWNYPQKQRKITIVGEKGSVIWEGERLIYNGSNYTPINGFDEHRNPNFKLTQEDSIDIVAVQEYDNLQLQLKSFLEQRRRNVCMEQTSYLVDFLKKNAYIIKK